MYSLHACNQHMQILKITTNNAFLFPVKTKYRKILKQITIVCNQMLAHSPHMFIFSPGSALLICLLLKQNYKVIQESLR
jgi:hypothetical protein